MYRRDYVLRLIERFGQMLIALRNRILRREVQAEEVRAQLQQIASEAGLDLDLARRLDARMLLMWLAPTGDVDPPRFWLMAELLYVEGMHARESGVADGGRADLERARAVFAALPPDWKPAADLASGSERCAEIARMLDGG